jgi:hypothetical protein
MTVPETHGSAKTSAKVALFLGSISNMRPIICLLSLGRSRSSRHGPLMTSGFFSPSVDPLTAVPVVGGCSLLGETAEFSATIALSGVLRSVVDLEGTPSTIFPISVPGVGVEAKSL